jgi:hypothetical protein
VPSKFTLHKGGNLVIYDSMDEPRAHYVSEKARHRKTNTGLGVVVYSYNPSCRIQVPIQPRLNKGSARPTMKSKLKAKGLGAWLKW